MSLIESSGLLFIAFIMLSMLLCTVKLSRRVFPGQPSYSLHKLTESLGLPDFNHHRALDDTMAAAGILRLAIEKVGEAGVLKYVVNLSVAKKLAVRQ